MRIFIAACLLMSVAALATAATAEEFEARSASIPAARQVTAPLDVRAMALPLAERQRIFDLRQAQIGEHHRPTPLTPLPQAEIARALAAVPQAANPTDIGVTITAAATAVTLIANRALDDTATLDVTSTVGEPSVGARGSEVLMTGNWYAAFSSDGGSTFSYVNPDTTFPDIPGQPFCCDQLADYDATNDVMFWFLQYVKDDNVGQNTVRLAVAQGADIASQAWRFYDFTPQAVGGWSSEWFDYPAMAVGENFLYITTNAFSTGASPSFRRSVILRIPLAQLADYQSLNLDFFDTTQHGSLRPSRGAGSTMYIGTHLNRNTIRIFSWPENSTTLSSDDVSVEIWSGGTSIAPGPDGNDWLGRVDSRITAGWLSDDTLGFAWTVPQDAQHDFPHVRVVLVDRNSMTASDQPHIWNDSFAFAYPSAAPNGDEIVGLSVFYGGGGQHHPSHAVGVLDPADNTWKLATTASGTHGPAVNKWGDYLAVRPHGSAANQWVATGYTLNGGSGRQDIEPRFIQFELAPPQPPIQATIALDPDERLGRGDQSTVRTTVTRSGQPQSGMTVTYSVQDLNLASVAPTSTQTDAAGIAEATVESNSSEKDETLVIAQVNGVTVDHAVRVPSLSFFGLLVLVISIALAVFVHRRRYWEH